jgi:hypothetical protein
MRVIQSLAIVACACVGLASSASAQSDVKNADWSHGTTLNGFVGVGVDSAQAGPALGGALGWEVTPRIAIEGSGSWLEFGGGTSAFGGALKVRARLFGQRTVDPFLQAGIGMYRATYGPGDEAVPDFYMRRMRGHMPAGELHETFTDPTVVAGGGVTVFVNRHLAIRPDVEATIVLDDGRSHVITTISLHVVYHFESHPVTPARARTRSAPR